MVSWTACVILIFDSLLTLKLTAWQYFSAFTAKSFTFWGLFMIYVSVMFTCRLFTVKLQFGLLFVHRIPISKSKELIRLHVRFWFQSSMSWQHVLWTDVSLPPFINCVHFLSIVAYSYLATLQKVSSSAHWWCLLFVIFLTDTHRFECCIIIHTHTHTRLTALFPGQPGWAGTRKVKPIWISLKQETVNGSGIKWAYASLHLAPDR